MTAARAAASEILQREQRHRQRVMLALALLILLSLAPLFGHHLFASLGAPLRGLDHVGSLCLIALHHLLEPVHEGFHLLFAGGIAFALVDRFRVGRQLRRTLKLLAAKPVEPHGRFWRAAHEAGMDPRSLCVVQGLPTPAFTVGWWRPRVYVARELAAHLAPDELARVLRHEQQHVTRRDPLRLSLLRSLAHTLFWVPGLRVLADQAAEEAEILADDAAAAGAPLRLASTILALAEWRAAPPAPAVAFHDSELLERRVRRLAGEVVAPRNRLNRRALIGAAAMLTLIWLSGAAVLHPLPADAADRHAAYCGANGNTPAGHVLCSAIFKPADARK